VKNYGTIFFGTCEARYRKQKHTNEFYDVKWRLPQAQNENKQNILKIKELCTLSEIHATIENDEYLISGMVHTNMVA